MNGLLGPMEAARHIGGPQSSGIHPGYKLIREIIHTGKDLPNGKKNQENLLQNTDQDFILPNGKMNVLTPDRLTAVDLTDFPEDLLAVIRREAIRRGITISEVATSMVREASERLIVHAGGGHHRPQSARPSAPPHSEEMKSTLPSLEGSNRPTRLGAPRSGRSGRGA